MTDTDHCVLLTMHDEDLRFYRLYLVDVAVDICVLEAELVLIWLQPQHQ